MADEPPTQIEVIKALSMALLNYQRAINHADIRVSLSSATDIQQAWEQANGALTIYNNWSLTVLRN